MNIWKLSLCLISCVLKGVDLTGIDIGYECNKDSECQAGNGGKFSTCNKWFAVCTCTINADREVQTFQQDRAFFECPAISECDENVKGSCKDCVARDNLKFANDEDWYGQTTRPPFGVLFIHDAPTAVCFEPERAKKSSPNNFVHVKESTIAGLGLFASQTLHIGTVFGPYKGFKPTSKNIPPMEERKNQSYAWLVYEETKFNITNQSWVDAVDSSRSNYLRYGNTPNKVEQENVIKVQYKGGIYYVTTRVIQRGTELAVWYGEEEDENLGIEREEPPEHDFAEVGHVNSLCYNDDGEDCTHDRNAVCQHNWCICKPGTSIVEGKCIYAVAEESSCDASKPSNNLPKQHSQELTSENEKKCA